MHICTSTSPETSPPSSCNHFLHLLPHVTQELFLGLSLWANQKRWGALHCAPAKLRTSLFLIFILLFWGLFINLLVHASLQKLAGFLLEGKYFADFIYLCLHWHLNRAWYKKTNNGKCWMSKWVDGKWTTRHASVKRDIHLLRLSLYNHKFLITGEYIQWHLLQY